MVVRLILPFDAPQPGDVVVAETIKVQQLVGATNVTDALDVHPAPSVTATLITPAFRLAKACEAANGKVKLNGVPPVSTVTLYGAVPPLMPAVIEPLLPAQVGLTGLVKVAFSELLEFKVNEVSIKQLGVPLSVRVSVYTPAAKLFNGEAVCPPPH